MSPSMQAAMKEFLVAAQQMLQASAAPTGNGVGGLGFFLPLVLMVGAMYIFMMLPQQKKDKERKKMLESLGKGDRVVTNGGICGTIVGVNDKTVVLKVSDDPACKIEFMRPAVSQITEKAGGKN
ncbi:MAG: preprotein translocase subunit YajC [Candidatus Hydrogenedentota bacterium]